MKKCKNVSKDNKDNKTCQEFLPVVKKRLENSSIKPNKKKNLTPGKILRSCAAAAAADSRVKNLHK